MSDRIAERQKRIAAKMLEMKAIFEKGNDEDEVSDDDKEKFASLKAEIENLKEGLSLLKTIREMEAEHAEPAEEDEEEKSFSAPIRKNFGSHRMVSKAPAPGIRAARFAISNAIAKSNGSRNAGVRFAQDMFNDDVVAKALNTTTQGDGGAVIPQDFVADLIDLVRAQTVVRGNGATVLPMPMGNATIPRLRAGATAQWQDELTAIVDSQPALDDLYFSAKKLTALVPVSADLMRRSPLSVEGIVRDDLVKQLALAEDKAFLLGTGTANQPAGIVTLTATANKIADTTASPTLGTVNNVLMSLELLLTANNISTAGAMWIFHPAVRSFLSTLTDSTGRYFFRDELEQGRLLGYGYKTTTQLPTNLNTNLDTQVFLVNMPDLIIADTLNMRVDSSDVASYGTNAANSAWTLDQVTFRAITEMDFNMKHGASAAIGTVRNWKPTGFTVSAGTSFLSEAAVTTGTAAKSAKP